MQTTKRIVSQTSRPKIDSLEHFKQEFLALYSQLDEDIAGAAQYERVQMNGPNNDLINNLNKLKIHRAKLKDMLMSFENASEEEWANIQPMAAEVYEEAQKARRQINRGVSD